MKQYLKHLIMSLVLVLSILLISVPAEASSTPEVSYSNQSITSFMLKPNFMSNSWTGFRDAYIDLQIDKSGISNYLHSCMCK